MNKPKLDHIGIAVRSLDAATIYKALGLEIEHVETVETQGVRTAFLSVGDANLELLEPISPQSPGSSKSAAKASTTSACASTISKRISAGCRRRASASSTKRRCRARTAAASPFCIPPPETACSLN
jgi:hypothetical protein